MAENEAQLPAVRRRRRRDMVERPPGADPVVPPSSLPEPTTGGEIAVYDPEASAPTTGPAIAGGHSFARPSDEFPAWNGEDGILATVFDEFVKRSTAHNSSAEEEKQENTYFEMVAQLVERHPEWGVQVINLPRLVELLRVYHFGYGPLEDYMKLDKLEELYFNRYDRGFYIIQGEKRRIPDILFEDEADFRRFVDHVARENGLTINSEKPNLDARLADGSRMNASLAPPAVDGPDFVIRKFRDIQFSVQDYIDGGMLTPELAADLKRWVAAGMNIIVSGGTATGKSTFLNTIGNEFIPKTDRLVVIENIKELQLYTDDTKYFQTLEDATRGSSAGGTDYESLLRQALRKRPDRIILGEVRGKEALQMLKAWNSGHDGSFCTIHADNAPSALDKLEQLSMEAGTTSERAVHKQIARSVDLVIQLERARSGATRRVTEVQQVLHPRKYDRRNTALNDQVRELFENEDDGLVQYAEGLWMLPLYELDGEGRLERIRDAIPVQGKS